MAVDFAYCTLTVVNNNYCAYFVNIFIIAVDFAYCKRTESDGIEKWYKFNDIRVTEIIDEREVVVRLFSSYNIIHLFKICFLLTDTRCIHSLLYSTMKL